MEFTIRKAVPADALAISIVSAYTWKTAYSGLLPDEMMDSRIAKLPQSAERMRQAILEKDDFLVATVDDTVVAFCAFHPSRDENYPNSGEIGAIYCLEGFHGYGIGKAIFQAGVKELIKMGYQTMMLNCLQGNPTLGFYQHMGGKVIARKEDVRPEHTLVEDVVFYEDLEAILR